MESDFNLVPGPFTGVGWGSDRFQDMADSATENFRGLFGSQLQF